MGKKEQRNEMDTEQAKKRKKKGKENKMLQRKCKGTILIPEPKGLKDLGLKSQIQ